MNSLSVFSLPYIICFFTTITAAFRHNEYLTDDISINCGSTENFAAVDGREWIGDSHEKISSYIQIKGSLTSPSIAGESIVYADQVQYKAARISRSWFSYTFRLSPGTKFIRLHFNPGPYRGFKGLKDLFTVEAGPFTLLCKFSASLTADVLDRNVKFFAREFLLWQIGRLPLPWLLYFEIISGVACGIQFLNKNPVLRKFYSSIDPCNIFLDADLNPKIANDYCGMTIKTSYYAPPEGYGASCLYASDIYGFGVLVLDLLSVGNPSKQHLDLVTLARRLRKEGRELELASKLPGVKYSSKEVLRCIEIALSCTQFEPKNRPNISEVVEALK